LFLTKSSVPSTDELDRFAFKFDRFKRSISTRKPTGEQRVDPLIVKRNHFLVATNSKSVLVEGKVNNSKHA